MDFKTAVVMTVAEQTAIEQTAAALKRMRGIVAADQTIERRLARLEEQMEEINAPSEESDDDGWEWAIVEIMGHRRHAGRIREVERLGVKMIRIDVPKPTGDADVKAEAIVEWETVFYPGTALFSLTPSDEATVIRKNAPYRLTHREDDED